MPQNSLLFECDVEKHNQKKKKKVTSLRGKNPARELCVLVHVLY